MFVEKGDLNLVAWLPVFGSAVPTNLPVGFIVDQDRLISMRDSDFHAFRVYAEPRHRSTPPRTVTSAGLLIALSLPPAGFWPLAFVGLALVDRVLADVPAKRRWQRGSLVGLESRSVWRAGAGGQQGTSE